MKAARVTNSALIPQPDSIASAPPATPAGAYPATARASTHGAAGTTSTTARSGNSVCSRCSVRRLIFLWLRIWLRRDQSINGNHRA